MRVNRLAWSLAITLGFVGHGRAAEQVADYDIVYGSNAVAAADEIILADDREPETYLQEVNSWALRDGWHDCLIGSMRAYHVYAGTEFTFLNIHTQTGGAITASFSDTTAPGVATSAFSEESGLDDNGSAPRFWLGIQATDKWGVRARHWQLGDSNQHTPEPNLAIPTTGSNFATIFTTDRVDARASDVEGVRNFELWGFKGDVFVGGRRVEFDTESDFLAFGVFTTGNFINLTLQNGVEFEGHGVTYGGSLRRQLGNSHLYWIGTARGSRLDGHTDSFGRSDGTVASSPDAPLVGAATVTRAGADADLYIFELQTGVEFEWQLQELPAKFFFRTAYEFQDWDIDGLPTGGASFGGTIGELTTNSFASAGAQNCGMVLHGVSFATGLTW